jgi:divalent metal cation (Fe/Co/Zn/Cd) transporter
MRQVAPHGARTRDLRKGIQLEAITIGWMLIEGAVAIVAGVVAGSALLIAFGLDSAIEMMSGGILLRRLSIEEKSSSTEQARVMQAERRAAWATGVLLGLLCLYVIATSILGLVFARRPELSIAGMILATAAVVGMPALARAKRRIAARIDSGALRADAACSMTCAYMAGMALVGLTIHAITGWWWTEYVAALGLLYWLVSEAREAFETAHFDGSRDAYCS